MGVKSMIAAKNLAVFLLVVQVLIAPGLGIEGDLPQQLTELEVGVAREAMKLIELEHLCQELAAEMSGAAGNENMVNSLASLSDRLEAVGLALQHLERQVNGISFAESEERISTITQDIQLLTAQNAVLAERIQALRQASATPRAPLGQNDSQTASDSASATLNRVACALLILSQEMRGSFLDISSAIGGGLGTLAGLSNARAPELRVLRGPSLVVTVFVLLLAVALASIAVQGYYRGRFAGNSNVVTRRSNSLHRSNVTREAKDGILSIDGPFWDAVPNVKGAPPEPKPAPKTRQIAPRTTGMFSSADEEYVHMLLKLGYKAEALRLASRVVDRPPTPGRAIPQNPGRGKSIGVGDRAGKAGGHLAPARSLYKKAYNSLIVAGRRSRRYKTRARRGTAN